MTQFNFVRDISDFAQESGGTSKWVWASTLGDHSGVMYRSYDYKFANVSSLCTMDSKYVRIVMDVLPRKYYYDSTFEVELDGTIYAKIVIPGDTKNQASSAAVTVQNGATTNMNALTTGKGYYDLKWTNGWEINITLSKIPTGKVRLTFNHTVSKAPGSDIAVDNVVIYGGTCGSHSACICHEGSEYAEAGYKKLNYKSDMWMTETVYEAAPGYVDYVEVTCAHCSVQNANGAIYTRYGKRTCPSGHGTVYTGYLVGSLSWSAGGVQTTLASLRSWV